MIKISTSLEEQIQQKLEIIAIAQKVELKNRIELFILKLQQRKLEGSKN
ncbi:MAG: hypothetical protein ACTSPP_11845 [Candidatus Heimdallarchaeaceae archaeon]